VRRLVASADFDHVAHDGFVGSAVERTLSAPMAAVTAL
jgi:hypothetical protein